MRLKEFLEETAMPIAVLSRRSGVHSLVINKILKGGKITLETAAAIQEATKGKVTALELLPPKEDKPESHHQKEAHKT